MATATWKPGDIELPSSSGRGYSVSSMKSEVLDGTTLTSNVEDSASDNLNAHNNGNGRSVPEVLRKEYAVSTRWQLEMEERKRRRAESKSSNPFECCLCFITGTCNMETVNNMFCCCSRRIGGMFSLIEKKDGTPIVIAGPCWPFCMFVTLPLILGITGLVTYFVVLNPNSKLPRWVAYIYLPFLVMTLTALFCVSCRDPGLLERVTDEEAGHGGWFWNEQVGSFRPTGAMYCRECKALIEEYDHLCPWTGTGIGRKNMCAFKWFVVSINILCYFSIGLVSFAVIMGVK